MILAIVSVVLAYFGFVVVRLGLHQRLPLAFGPISLDRIADRAARRHGERPLFSSDTPCAWAVPALRARYSDRTHWSAVQIGVTADFVARLLRDRLHVARGDRVAVCKQNHLDVHILVTSIVRAGGIACPINGKFAADELDPYLTRLDARVLFSDSVTLLRVLDAGGGVGPVGVVVLAEARGPELLARQARVAQMLAVTHPAVALLWLEDALAHVHAPAEPVRRDEGECLYIVHSSGTTGVPKPVVLTNGRQSHALRGWLCYVHVRRGADKGYLSVPNNHQAVILTFHGLLLLGIPTHWKRGYDRDGLDAEEVIRDLARGHYTGYFGFPIAYTQLKEVPLREHDLSRMRFWASTADASHEAIQRPFVVVGSTFLRLGLPFPGSVYLDAQGSSEVGTPSVIRYVTPLTGKFDRRIGRPGSTPFGPSIRVVRPDGLPARRGDAGRLEVRGKTVFPEYWQRPDLTRSAFHDGWFFTGDIVRRGSDGHLVQLDREVDVIRTRDGDVYSLPIEEKLHKHPAVFDVCVYGAVQPDGTQRPAAAVALRTGMEMRAEQVREELNRLLMPEERLERLETLPWEAFPIGITGKTLKRVFRERSVLAPLTG